MSFAAAGSRAWNRLPPLNKQQTSACGACLLCRVHSAAVFKRQLKTFLFDCAFNWHYILGALVVLWHLRRVRVDGGVWGLNPPATLTTPPCSYDFRPPRGVNVAPLLLSHIPICVLCVYCLPHFNSSVWEGIQSVNLQHTKLRNKLQVATVCSLLMISINGPPLERWRPRKYVVSWLKSGHRGALHKASGPPKKQQEVSVSAALFLGE